MTVCAGAVATMVAHLALLLARSSLPVPLELSWKTALIPLLVAILLALVSSLLASEDGLPDRSFRCSAIRMRARPGSASLGSHSLELAEADQALPVLVPELEA